MAKDNYKFWRVNLIDIVKKQNRSDTKVKFRFKKQNKIMTARRKIDK